MYKQNLTKVKKFSSKIDSSNGWISSRRIPTCACASRGTWLATKAPNDGSGHNNDSGNDVNADIVDIGDDGPWLMDTPP